MAQSISNFDAALKEFYLPRLQSTINTNRVLMTRLERESGKTDASGRRAVVPVNIQPSQAVGARADEAALPTAQHQKYAEVRISYKYNYGTIRLSHPTIAASRNDKGAFIRVVGSEMDGIRRDLKNDINRQLFGYGHGAIGIINAAQTTDNEDIVLKAGHSVKPGMVIDTYVGSGSGDAKQLDSITVTAVDGNSISATYSTNVTANALVYREDSRDQEMMGLQGIVDDASKTSGIGAFVTTLHNIARGTYPQWNAQVLEHGTPGTAREITEDLLDTAQLQVMEQAEGDSTLGITSTTQFRKIAHLMTPDRRYSPSGMTLEGGFKAIEWAGTPIVWDRDCPTDANGNHMLFFLDENTLKFYQLADWDFDDTDGSILHRRSGYAQYDAQLFYYAQLGCLDPAANAVIRDLSTS
jgi:hypothetical protein